jgi:hypothetical protein
MLAPPSLGRWVALGGVGALLACGSAGTESLFEPTGQAGTGAMAGTSSTSGGSGGTGGSGTTAPGSGLMPSTGGATSVETCPPGTHHDGSRCVARGDAGLGLTSDAGPSTGLDAGHAGGTGGTTGTTSPLTECPAQEPITGDVCLVLPVECTYGTTTCTCLAFAMLPIWYCED